MGEEVGRGALVRLKRPCIQDLRLFRDMGERKPLLRH